MTRAEALAEVKRRWGQHATAFLEVQTGKFVVGGPPDWYGEGDSWEAAFADADRRAK